jgi:PleD family two-component response regulator
MTISQGLVIYQQGESMDHFIARSDKALYAAKEAGRDCVIIHEVQN